MKRLAMFSEITPIVKPETFSYDQREAFYKNVTLKIKNHKFSDGEFYKIIEEERSKLWSCVKS